MRTVFLAPLVQCTGVLCVLIEDWPPMIFFVGWLLLFKRLEKARDDIYSKHLSLGDELRVIMLGDVPLAQSLAEGA